MDDINRLIEEHQAMDDMARELIELARHSEPQPLEAFNAMRRLSACLDEHLAGEAGFLYRDHLAARPDRLEEEVRRFEADFADLTEEWTLYLREWTLDNIAIDWCNYAHATLWIMGRLRERIAQENDILYPLALHHGRIRLRS
jgi:hypothetical protein